MPSNRNRSMRTQTNVANSGTVNVSTKDNFHIKTVSNITEIDDVTPGVYRQSYYDKQNKNMGNLA